MNKASFTLDMKVRDYECDIQGIVNNSVYQNYYEHCRHEFILARGFSFSALSKQGVNLVVIRAEIDYRAPLKSGDEFTVSVTCEKQSKVRFVFTQSIHRKNDEKLVSQGKFQWTAMNEKGRPMQFEDIAGLL